MEEFTSTDLRISQPPKTLRAIVTGKMRDAILSGYFKPGERLVERTLCDQLGVSRTVVRETLRYLEAEGLIEFRNNRGPVVARLDWPQARQIYRVRQLLEADAAADCARVADDTIKAALRSALSALEAAYESTSQNTLFEASLEFYRCIFSAAGHDVAWDVVNRLNGRISRLRGLTLSTADRHRSGFARMKAICEAIAANDPAAAAAAVREHLDEASEIARHQLEANS